MAKPTTDYTQSNRALQTQQENSPQALVLKRKAFLEARIKQIAQWVRGGVRPEALIRFSLLDMQQNQKLREADPQSIYLALLACAVTGLEPGALKGEAYLVPFAGKAQFMAGYKGLIKMAKRSGEVHGLTSNVVYERDNFSIDLGTGNSIVHGPAHGDRGDVIGAYAIAKMASGHHELEWVDRIDLDAIRKVAENRGKSPAWQSWPTEMQRKSVIRRLSKRLPLGNDYIMARAIEEAQDEHGDASSILDLETDGAASAVANSTGPVIDVPAGDVSAEEAAEIARLEAQGRS